MSWHARTVPERRDSSGRDASRRQGALAPGDRGKLVPHYYFSPYVFVREDDFEFLRPRGGEQQGWKAIDFRPSNEFAQSHPGGFAFLEVPTADPSIGPYLGDDPGADRTQLRGFVQGALGVRPEATTIREILAELLMVHGREDGTRWRGVRPSRDGQSRIWLGGQRWGTFRAIRGGSTIVCSFNTGDSDTLGPELSFTEVAGDADIVSNEAKLI